MIKSRVRGRASLSRSISWQARLQRNPTRQRANNQRLEVSNLDTRDHSSSLISAVTHIHFLRQVQFISLQVFLLQWSSATATSSHAATGTTPPASIKTGWFARAALHLAQLVQAKTTRSARNGVRTMFSSLILWPFLARVLPTLLLLLACLFSFRD